MEQLVKEALKGVKLIAGKCSWERAEKPHWEMEGLMRSMGRLECLIVTVGMEIM